MQNSNCALFGAAGRKCGDFHPRRIDAGTICILHFAFCILHYMMP